ncbi:hypothetical protein AB7W86_00820 [Providencia rettgeri]
MTLHINTKGYYPSITFDKDFRLSIENHEVKKIEGDTDALFTAMDAPIEEIVDFLLKREWTDALMEEYITRGKGSLIFSAVAKLSKDAA